MSNNLSSLPDQTSVVIIGGGMAGLSCAASLARQGVSDVVLLEAKTLAHAQASSTGEAEAEEAEVVDEEVLETASVEEAIDMTVASEETEDGIQHVRANLRDWVNSYVLKTEQGESE